MKKSTNANLINMFRTLSRSLFTTTPLQYHHHHISYLVITLDEYFSCLSTTNLNVYLDMCLD